MACQAASEAKTQAARQPMMQITEIFRSIQGESTYAGLPCIFVRLTGCNLRCTWCDTAYAFYGGKRMNVEDVTSRVQELSVGSEIRDALAPASLQDAKVSLVELTGGEPLLQPDVVPLAQRLLAENYTVLVETSGERFVGILPQPVVKIVDVKCPDSGEGGTFLLDNLKAIDTKDEIKFVIASRADYEFARDFSGQHALAHRVRQVLFSPVFPDPNGSWSGLDPRLLAEWILADRLPVRLGMQLHKFIWHPATRGV
jgi:7-carboxy-7-deazaguanine synthase